MKKFKSGPNTGIITVLTVMVFMLSGIYISMIDDPLMMQPLNRYALMFMSALVTLLVGLFNDGKFVKK